MTLKTGAMAAENIALPSQEYITFMKTSVLNCNNISQYYCFYFIFYPMNASFVSIIFFEQTNTVF